MERAMRVVLAQAHRVYHGCWATRRTRRTRRGGGFPFVVVAASMEEGREREAGGDGGSAAAAYTRFRVLVVACLLGGKDISSYGWAGR